MALLEPFAAPNNILNLEWISLLLMQQIPEESLQFISQFKRLISIFLGSKYSRKFKKVNIQVFFIYLNIKASKMHKEIVSSALASNLFILIFNLKTFEKLSSFKQ